MMSKGHQYAGKKIHVESGHNDNLAACGAPMAGQNGYAFTRRFVTCDKCKKTKQYKLVPHKL